MSKKSAREGALMGRSEARREANRLLEDISHDYADKHIYTLVFERTDGELFFYVGQTVDLKERIIQHLSAGNMQRASIPGNISGYEIHGEGKYIDIIDVLEVEPYDNPGLGKHKFEAWLRWKEHVKMLETSMELDTHRVIGGR